MNKRILKCACALVTSLTLTASLTACNANIFKKQILLENTPETLELNDTFALSATTKLFNKKLTRADVFWESSDYAVVSVDEYGNAKAVGEGGCYLRARDRKNLTNYAETFVFLPYTTQVEGMHEVTRVNTFISTDVGQYLLKKAKDIGKLISGKPLKIVGVLGTMFFKDQEAISGLHHYSDITNAVLYTLSDWTNEAVTLNLDSITTETLYQQFLTNWDLGNKAQHSYGTSFEDSKSAVKNLLSGLAKDGYTYYFNEMNPEKQYRIVVRGDFSYCVTETTYEKGIVSGLWEGIGEIFTGQFGALSDNLNYKISYNEMLFASNLRLCLEEREVRV